MNSDMENEEWLNDYMSLKQVKSANPFVVPEGYFDGLADRIVSLKNLDELKKNTPAEGFTVPENYFDELAKNIQSRIAIETTLNTEDTGFGVPEGYFDELANNIQSRIEIETILNTEGAGFGVPEGYFDELTNNIQSRLAVEAILNTEDAGFGVPEGYFDNLPQQLQSRILIEEAIGDPAGHFSVPEGYFEDLNQRILNQTVGAPAFGQAQVKHMGIVRKLYRSTAFKYATAACFALAIGGGILLFQSPDPETAHKRSFLHKELSGVPIDDIKSYLQLNEDAGDTQQQVTSEGTSVNDADLKNALKDYVDSVQ